MNYSSLSTLLSCPRKYLHSVVEGYAPPATKVALLFGTLWHKIMELDNLGHENPVEAAIEAVHWTDPFNDYRTAAKAAEAYKLYRQQYPQWDRVIETETSIGATITGALDIFEGRYDAVVEYDGKKWLVDYKTASRLEQDWTTYYNVSNQFALYYAAVREKYEDLAGVIVDVALIPRSKTPEFHRLFLVFHEDQLDEALCDFVMGTYIESRYKDMWYFPKNTSACHQFGGPCPFLDVCDVGDPVLRKKMLEESFVVDPHSSWEGGVIDESKIVHITLGGHNDNY